MSEIVPQHSHCQICGKTIPVTETLCSEECKEKYHAITYLVKDIVVTVSKPLAISMLGENA